MIKIGDFARIAGISVAALRHYDEERLLSPSYVNPDSNYRYYGVEQLRDVNRILVLKSLGFSLPEIRGVMRGPFDPTEMRRLLAEKRAEAEARLEEELAQIRRIEQRILLIEKEQTMPDLEVIRKTMPAMNLATIRLHIPTNDQVGELMPQAFGRLFSGLEAQKVQPRGHALALWHSTPDMLTDEVVDVAVQVDVSSVAGSEIVVLPIPETEVASVVHTGPFSEFQQCHVALAEWLAKNGCRLNGAYREIYYNCEGDLATTEVQYPITADVVAGVA